MQKSIETIQQKADQIYNKFKSYFAYQVIICLFLSSDVHPYSTPTPHLIWENKEGKRQEKTGKSLKKKKNRKRLNIVKNKNRKSA